MSLPQYCSYKASGSDWLGKVPRHWEVTKLCFITNRIGSGKTPTGGAQAYVSAGIIFIRSQNVHDDGLRLDDVVFINETTDREMAWSRVKPLDVLLNITGASIGRSCLVPVDFKSANVNQHVCVIRLENPKALARWVAWAMISAPTKCQVEASQTGAAREGLNFEQLSKFQVCVPPIEERTKVIHFLDHETAKIDALIREQERLIALLQEKRQAVISHAVTKGLDPSVPMKDSGVEWLGEVPEHWRVGKLRWYATIQGGLAKGKDYQDKETVSLPYLRVANVQAGYVDLTEVKETPLLESEVERYSLKSGDVLMNEGGDNDKLGRGAVWKAQINPCLHQNHVFAIRPNVHLLPEWLAMFTQSTRARSYFFLNSKQSTNLASISSSNVMNLDLPMPSVDEQEKILQHLGSKLQQFTDFLIQAEKGVNLLLERRSALISAAVTGKIDVRDWQPPADESAFDSEVIEAGSEVTA